MSMAKRSTTPIVFRIPTFFAIFPEEAVGAKAGSPVGDDSVRHAPTIVFAVRVLRAVICEKKSYVRKITVGDTL